MSIPRRIIQTGKNQTLSPAAKAAVAILKLLHPHWEYRYFDDGDIRAFLRAECPEYEVAFDAFPRAIQRIDFFRYVAIHRLGGFYFDLDVFLSESLEPLLEEGCVFPFEELSLNRYLRSECGIDWEIGNYAFGATAGHPFLKAAIENCVRSQTDDVWRERMMQGTPSAFRSEFEVLNTTGPGLLTRTLAERPETSTDMHILFPEDVRDEAQWHLFGNHGIHLMNGSWRTRGGFFRRKAANAWESWIRSRLMPESIAAGPTRLAPGTHPRVAAAAPIC